MSMQDTFGELFSPSRLASTGYRFGICVVVGSAAGMSCFLLVWCFFYLFDRILAI